MKRIKAVALSFSSDIGFQWEVILFILAAAFLATIAAFPLFDSDTTPEEASQAEFESGEKL